MAKFVVLYYAPKEAMKMMENASPEEMKKGMEPWMAWANKCGDNLLDLGSPLGPGQKVSSDGSTPSESEVTGYSMLQAENMDDAKKLLDGHPHLSWTEGCRIEIHECMPLPN